MEKFKQMKSFISNALTFDKFKDENCANSLQAHLQILSVTDDLSVFEPSNKTAVEFYVSLHELMSGEPSNSPLLWHSISVLQHACKNRHAKYALVNTYKFLPILAKVMTTNLTPDRKIKLLHLMQELTSGIKILWQEEFLGGLIENLTSVISNKITEVVVCSINVLVNLCYKNIPAIHTYLQTVANKQFLRSLLNLVHDRSDLRVQVFKLVLIEEEEVSGQVPEYLMLNFIETSLSALEDVIKSNDAIVLKHIIDFFDDASQDSRSRAILLTYQGYRETVLSLLQSTRQLPHKSISMLFEFFNSLVAVEIPALIADYDTIVDLAIEFCVYDDTSLWALTLIHNILMKVKCNGHESDLYNEKIMEQLELGIESLLLLAENTQYEQSKSRLFILLRELIKEKNLRNKILNSSLKQKVKNLLLLPLLSADPLQMNNIFDWEMCGTLLGVMELVEGLAEFDESWNDLYNELLNQETVHSLLAMALLAGSEDIKSRVLRFVSSVRFANSSIPLLAKSLHALQPLVMLPQSTTLPSAVPEPTPVESTTSINKVDEMNVNKLIDLIEDAVEKKELTNVATTAVIELYEHKFAALRQTERTLAASLTSATSHCIHLQHRLALISVESERLYKLLYHSQKCFESSQLEKHRVGTKLSACLKSSDEAHQRHVQEMKHKQKIIDTLNEKIADLENVVSHQESESKRLAEELNAKIEKLEKQISDYLLEIKSQDQKNKDYVSKNEELRKCVSILETRVAKREKIIEERDTRIQNLEQNVKTLEADCSNLDMLCKAQNKSIQQKDEELNATRTQLGELQMMRNMIMDISSGKFKMEKK